MAGIVNSVAGWFRNKMEVAPGAREDRDWHDGYYDEYDEDEYENDYEPEQPLKINTQTRDNKKSKASASRNRGSSISNVYGFTSPASSASAVQPSAETYLVHPKVMDDAVEIGSHVRNGRMCIVDLTGVASTEAQRIADYLCGCSDTVDGSVNRISNTIIAVSPRNHKVMRDYRGDSSPFDEGFFNKASAAR